MKATIMVLGIGAMALVAALLLTSCANDEPEEATPAGIPAAQEAPTEIAQKTCPVMGGKIDPSIYVDHNGQRVYFCCKQCVETFKADPEKYLKKLAEDAGSPEMHGHMAGGHEEQVVKSWTCTMHPQIRRSEPGLCPICQMNLTPVKEDVGAAHPAGAPTEIAQKTCPVMGGKIDPSIYVDHNGQRVYFCCKQCVETFKADPEKYLKKLAEDAGSPEMQEHMAGHEGHN